MALASVLFGAGYVVTKVVVTRIPPDGWICLRVLAGAIVLLLCFGPALRPARLTGRDYRYLLLCSLFGIVLNQVFFAYGLYRSTPAHAVLINGLIPVFAMVVGRLLGREAITAPKAAGFALGLLGLGYLLELDRAGWSAATWTGDLLNLANALSYSIYLAISRGAFQRYGWRASITAMYLLGIPGAALVGGWSAWHFDWAALPVSMLGAIAFLILGPTVTAYTANAWAMETVEASQVAAYVYVQPIVAMGLGYLWLGDPITPRLLVSSLLIFGGMTLAAVVPHVGKGRTRP
jgi:drug/metabolite transporter (DMT)-like permease